MTPLPIGELLLFLALLGEAYVWRHYLTERRALGLLAIAAWVGAWRCLDWVGQDNPEWGWAGVTILLVGLTLRIWQCRTREPDPARLALVSINFWLGAAFLTQRLEVGGLLFVILTITHLTIGLASPRSK